MRHYSAQHHTTLYYVAQILIRRRPLYFILYTRSSFVGALDILYFTPDPHSSALAAAEQRCAALEAELAAWQVRAGIKYKV